MSLQKAFDSLEGLQANAKAEEKVLRIGGEVYRLDQSDSAKANDPLADSQAKLQRSTQHQAQLVVAQMRKFSLRANKIKDISETVKDYEINYVDSHSPGPVKITEAFKKERMEAKVKRDRFFRRASSKVDTNLRRSSIDKSEAQMSVEVSDIPKAPMQYLQVKPTRLTAIPEKSLLSNSKGSSASRRSVKPREHPSHSRDDEILWMRSAPFRRRVYRLKDEIQVIRNKLMSNLLKFVGTSAKSETQNYKGIESLNVFQSLKEQVNSIAGRLDNLRGADFEEKIAKLESEAKQLKGKSSMMLYKVDDAGMLAIDRYKKEVRVITHMQTRSFIDDKLKQALANEQKRLMKSQTILNNRSLKSQLTIEIDNPFGQPAFPSQPSSRERKNASAISKGSLAIPPNIHSQKIDTVFSGASTPLSQAKSLKHVPFSSSEKKLNINVRPVDPQNKPRLLAHPGRGTKATPSRAQHCHLHLNMTMAEGFLASNKPSYVRFRKKKQRDTMPTISPKQQDLADSSMVAEEMKKIKAGFVGLDKNQMFDWISRLEEKYHYLKKQVVKKKPHLMNWHLGSSSPMSPASHSRLDVSADVRLQSLEDHFNAKLQVCSNLKRDLESPYRALLDESDVPSRKLSETLLDKLLEIADPAAKKERRAKLKVKSSSVSKLKLAINEPEEFARFKKSFNVQVSAVRKLDRAIRPEVYELEKACLIRD
jgi:hypothetical protein